MIISQLYSNHQVTRHAVKTWRVGDRGGSLTHRMRGGWVSGSQIMGTRNEKEGLASDSEARRQVMGEKRAFTQRVGG